VTLDARERFSGLASLYDRHRPSYPAELLDWIVASAGLRPGDPVADVGCGTGITTRLFAERGFEVVGVDPNHAMLAEARAIGPGRYVSGEAVATGLPAVSQALVSVGQAFHWFDIPATLREFRRVLRPGGWCAVFWNVRGASPFLDAYDRLLREHSSEYSVLDKPAQTLAALRARPETRDLREAEFRYAQTFDRDGLFGRAYSSSYVVHGIADHPAFDRALGALFDEHAQQGRVEFAYRTLAVCFRLDEPPVAMSPPVAGPG
jgi:ubiquinone/menaquinone biosynthesis C-methylase UbiE